MGALLNVMRTKLNRLSARYRAALGRHLKAGPAASLQPAVELGRQAAALRLETLGLARIHEDALTALVAAGGSSRERADSIKRARAFFSEAVAPIEDTHRASVKANLRLQQPNQTLRHRTAETAASARDLRRGIRQRQAAEAALRKSGEWRDRLLEESRRLQRHSRHLTHQILSAQEEEWRKLSSRLRDEIVQTLLGINVRLLMLKRVTKASTGSLKKEVASIQRLVRQSVHAINRFTREFGLRHET
jgi:signal transduction histidine kinase